MYLFFLSVFFCFASAQAAETEYRLPTLSFTGNASFESLSEETYAPSEKYKFNTTRTSISDDLSKKSVFPVNDFGYATAANGINLAGRTIDDTQVSTLGVPLNLPQGGGPDFSFFPSYLWSEASISPVLSGTGFSPQAASGSVQFKLWTREMVRDVKSNAYSSRLTLSYDRNLQSYSLGSKAENIAIMAGGNMGRKDGAAGSLSYYFLRKPGHHLLFHVLGSDQKGKSPASLRFPGPDANKKTWRIIPVLESHQELGSGFILESTLYGDLHEFVYEDVFFSSATRTQQYGIENVLINGPNTFTLSVRYMHFQQSGIGKVMDWPILSSFSREFFLDPQWSLRPTIGATYLTDPGVAPSAKIATKREAIENGSKDFYFSELGTQPKMPTINARYYQLPPLFRGNPNLQPERVNYFLIGYENKLGKISSTTSLKAEYRSAVQITRGTTSVNAGNASLFYLKEDLGFKLFSDFHLSSSTLFSYSRLNDTGYAYPDLPYASGQLGLNYLPSDSISVNLNEKFVGPSTESTGRYHAPYVLTDASLDYQIYRDITLTGGVDNIFDTRAQVVLDYPLPGRVFFLSAKAFF